MTTQARTEDQAPYIVTPAAQSDDWIIKQAMAILETRLTKPKATFQTPDAVKQYLTLRAGARKDQHIEVFAVLFLDSQSRMIEIEDLCQGTLSQTSVYPREVVRAALRHNAAAVIFSHNHPSGSVQPSRADEHLTRTLKESLALVDVRVLDHIITSGGQALSMAEQGLV
jgi:DNA repair protein RadC